MKSTCAKAVCKPIVVALFYFYGLGILHADSEVEPGNKAGNRPGLIGGQGVAPSINHGSSTGIFCQPLWFRLLENPLTAFSTECKKDEELLDHLMTGQASFDDILNALESDNEDMIYFSVTALLNYREEDEVVGLLRNIWLENHASHPTLSWTYLTSPGVKTHVAQILGSLDRSYYQEAYDFLIDKYQHEDVRVRLGVASGLGWLGEDEVIPILEQMVLFDDESVGGNAIGSLAQIGTPRAKEALLRLQNHPDVSTWNRSQVSTYLSRSESRAADVDAFPVCPGESTSSFDESRSNRAEQSHAKLLSGRASYEDLVHAFTLDNMNELVSHINATIVYIHDPQLRSLLGEIWRSEQSKHPDFNWNCLSEPMAKVSLARLLADAGTDADPSYLSYLNQATSEPNQHVRWAAVFALGEVGSDADLSLLERIVLNDNSSVSEMAVKAIARLDTPRSRDTLRNLRNDPSLAPEIRSIASDALKNLQ